MIAGCSSSNKTVNRYYVIEAPDSAQTSIDQGHPLTESYCEILPVEIYPAFASREIANRSGSHEIIYYQSHYWASNPGKSLTLFLEDYLNNASVFKRASTRFWKVNPAYKLETRIYQLEVVQKDDDLAAHLAFELRLFSSPENNLLISYKTDRTEKLHEKDLNLFAQTIGQLFYEALNIFSQKIINRITETQELSE